MSGTRSCLDVGLPDIENKVPWSRATAHLQTWTSGRCWQRSQCLVIVRLLVLFFCWFLFSRSFTFSGLAPVGVPCALILCNPTCSIPSCAFDLYLLVCCFPFSSYPATSHHSAWNQSSCSFWEPCILVYIVLCSLVSSSWGINCKNIRLQGYISIHVYVSMRVYIYIEIYAKDIEPWSLPAELVSLEQCSLPTHLLP